MTEAQENNKALVRRLLEVAHTEGDLDAIDELLSSRFVDHSLISGQEGDHEGYKRGLAEMRTPFSHQRLTIEDQIAEGDKVLTRATFHGVHDRGEFLGLAPTGEEWDITAMLVHRIAGGKIVEEWSESTIDPWLQRLEAEMRERERVEQEMRVARTIQQASLPKEVPELAGWRWATRRTRWCSRLERASSSTATGWSRLTPPTVRCSASPGCGRTLPSTARRDRWGTSS